MKVEEWKIEVEKQLVRSSDLSLLQCKLMCDNKSEKDQHCAAEIEHVKDTAGKFLHQAIQENKKTFDDELKKYRSQLDDDLRRRLVCLLFLHRLASTDML